MFCSRCGTEMPDNVAYCPKCGTPISKKESSTQKRRIILSTTETIPKLEVAEILGVVSAPIAMARWFGADFMAGIKDVFGGRVNEYEKLMRNATDEAFERLKREAERLGADAVIGIKLFSPDIGGTRRIGEIVAYGTAVKVKNP